MCKAYATPPDHHDRHKSLHESHIQGQATHAEFNVPPLQCQRVIGWEPIGSNAYTTLDYRRPFSLFLIYMRERVCGRPVAFYEQEDRLLRRAHAMTRAQHQAKPNRRGAHFLRSKSNAHRSRRNAFAEPCISRQILEEALVALEGSPLRDFGEISAIRAVVKASISYHRKTACSAIKAEASDDALKYRFPGIPPIGMLPWPERAVYFLREALRYSRRDIALLLRMSDASVDQLFVFAERRICYAGETPFLSLAHASELSREVKPNHTMAAGLLGRTA